MDSIAQEPLEFTAPLRKPRWRGVVPDGHSRCSRCGEIKPLNEFAADATRSRGVQAFCTPCRSAHRSTRYHANPVVKAGRKNSELKRKYGITSEQRDAMLKAQGWRCAICEAPFTDSRTTHVDHSHTTGVVRGLLCARCNINLPILEDEAWRSRAETYLRQSPPVLPPPIVHRRIKVVPRQSRAVQSALTKTPKREPQFKRLSPEEFDRQLQEYRERKLLEREAKVKIT